MGVSAANDKQHGGDHYRKREYQHWDFVCDTNMPYLLGCATKYAARWRDKNGAEDLNKCVHYMEKAQERGVRMSSYHMSHLDRFCAQLDPNDAMLVRFIVQNNLVAVQKLVAWLQDPDGA